MGYSVPVFTQKEIDNITSEFLNICNRNYCKTGDDCDYDIEINDEKKKIYLRFQESGSKNDWKNNLNFFVGNAKIFFTFAKSPYKEQVLPFKVHRGILKAYKSANDDIMNRIFNILNEKPDYNLTITGWSHGAGLALFAAEDFNFRSRTDKKDPNTGKKADVYTFGGPAVIFGDDSVEYFKKCINKIYEFCNNKDIVTYLPPKFFGYRHVNRVNIASFIVESKKMLNPQKYHTTYYMSSYYIIDKNKTKNEIEI